MRIMMLGAAVGDLAAAWARPCRGFGAAVVALFLIQVPYGHASYVPESFADLIEDLNPAVVNITVTQTAEAVEPFSGQIPNPFKGTPFEDFFRQFRDQQTQPDQGLRRRASFGSGFIISSDGYIVTNNHVISGASGIEVDFFDGTSAEATVVGADPKTDIALLRVSVDEPLPFLEFGDSNEARVGDWVVAIGNPLGQSFSASAGIISARGRALDGAYDDYIQTDAAINRGNSGGPLFNLDGKVIGVNTIIISPTGGSIGLGFAMSSNVVAPVVEQLLDHGETRRGWLGVSIQDIDPEISEAIGLEGRDGALVTNMMDGGPAENAGIQQGDVILSLDGTDVDDVRSLVRLVGRSEIGKEVPVKIFRDGEEMTLSVVLGRREDAERDRVVPAAFSPEEPETDTLLGMELSALTDIHRETFGLEEGADGVVITDVDVESEAYSKGIRAGDVIAEVGQEDVQLPGDVASVLKDKRDAGQASVLVLVKRGDGAERFVGLSIEAQ